MNNKTVWSVTLCRELREPLELRLAKIISYLASKYPEIEWLIEDIDGLSNEAGALAERINETGSFPLKHTELIGVIEADGQIIELNAVLINNTNDNVKYYRVIVRDGSSIDVVGKPEELLPGDVLGNYKEVDEGLYL